MLLLGGCEAYRTTQCDEGVSMNQCQYVYERGRGWVRACRQPAPFLEPSEVTPDGWAAACDAHQGKVAASLQGKLA